MKAVVLAAESEVHKAMAAALKSGKVGVLDYYKLQNLEADTDMRKSISGKADKDKDKPPMSGPMGRPGNPFEG